MRTEQREKQAVVTDVLFGFLYAWIVDRDPAARKALRRYCEYICFQGAPGFVSEAIDALEHKDNLGAEAWIRQTEAQYVQDKRAMLRYILGV